MTYAKYIFLFLILITASPLLADETEENFPCEQEECWFSCSNKYDTYHSLHFRRANAVYIGPEISHVKRVRSGGTKQSGNLAAIRTSYERIKRYHYYLGAQLLYGTGILRGHTGGGDKIRSRLKEELIEGNIGYTFQTKCFPHASITPFVGYGYFRDTNKFSPPSNLQIKFTTQFRYISFGCLSSIYVLPCLTIGVNARLKWPLQTRCKVTDDPDFDTIRQIVEDKLQYRIELPVTYFGSCLWQHFEFALVPFYEERLYGARENYPFDFFRTKFTLYGVNAQLIYRF
jgi:hypothetical protein